MGADDDRFRHSAQTPAGGDAVDLAQGVLAIAPGADQNRIGAALDAVQGGVIGAVEEELHAAGQGRQHFGRREQVAVGGQDVVGPRLVRMQQPQRHPWLGRGPPSGGFGHLARAAGDGIEHDQQCLHAV